METLLNYISSIYPINNALKEDLAFLVKRKFLPKKSQLLKPGEIANRIYFLEQGLARAYYYKEGNEITSWFMAENDVIISVYSFFLQKPGVEYIELLEDSVVYYIDYKTIQEIYRDHIEFNFVGRILTEKYYVLSEERAMSLRMHSARERYGLFMENYSFLVNRVPLFYIASYLGMSRETLSRIRADIK